MNENTSRSLVSIPKGLSDPLFDAYEKIASNYAWQRWEPSELNGGKFCEVVFSILDGSLKGTYSAKPKKPENMVDACRGLEKIAPDSKRIGDRSMRILIPRMLIALYEIRNNRGVGHVGGDVDPNYMDATAVYTMASWTLAELIRIFHDTSPEEAQGMVDTLVERKHLLIWEVGPTKRVLDPNMKKSDQVLLLLHQKPSWVADADLASWVEYSNESMFRKRVLAPLHKSRLIEHDQKERRSKISPTGIAHVETRILKSHPLL